MGIDVYTALFLPIQRVSGKHHWWQNMIEKVLTQSTGFHSVAFQVGVRGMLTGHRIQNHDSSLQGRRMQRVFPLGFK